MIVLVALAALLATTTACAGAAERGPGAETETPTKHEREEGPTVIADPAFIVDITTPHAGETAAAAALTEISGEFVSALVDVERIDVALVQPGEECAWWSARKARLTGGACNDPLWNEAELGSGTWTLPLTQPLPAGTWTAMVAANERFGMASGTTEIEFVLT